MRRLLVGLLALSSCAAPAPPAVPAPTPAPAPAPTSPSGITVVYRDAANVFEILDNLSGWWKGKCDPEYREEWARRFGISAEDEQRFLAYKQIRKRYYPRPESDPQADPATTRNGLFAPLKAPDRLAEAFYASSTVDAALSTVAAWMPPEDLGALRQFYDAYRPRYEALLAESRAYPVFATALQQKLDAAQAASFYRDVAHFYGVTEPARFTVLYVWWPPVDHIQANNRGSFLILKYHPDRHRDDAGRDVEIPVHELVHYVSAHQPDERKQALTRAFLAGCDMRQKMPSPTILEEPLAEAQQKIFLRLADPARLDFTKRWYSNKWIDAFAKAIYAPVSEAHQGGLPLDEALVGRLAAACHTLEGSF